MRDETKSRLFFGGNLALLQSVWREIVAMQSLKHPAVVFQVCCLKFDIFKDLGEPQ